jgi:GNAT superfamily N-acetyltransferase
MLSITNPTAAELESALQFAFQHLPPHEFVLRIETMMQRYQDGGVDLQGIFQARQGSALVGALYAQSRPDGSVMFWVPTMAKGFALESMLEPLVQFCRSKNAFAAVALADRTQQFDEQTFCTAGRFQFLSDLIHLAVEVLPNESSEEPYRLRFVPLAYYAEDITDRLTQLVQTTYHHSLDFPALMHIAPVEHVFQGYKTCGQFRPELWFFVQYEEADVGVLFLTDAASDQFELTYMGLIESARRQGFSREIVRFAKETTSRWERPLLLTSVDEQNIPACQSYLSHGFKAWDRKKVYARLF